MNIMCSYNRNCFLSALLAVFLLCSLSVQGSHDYEFALRGEQQMSKSISLKDNDSGEHAGRLELGISLSPGQDTTSLHLSFDIPDGLSRGYNSVFLFDDRYDNLDLLFSFINRRSVYANYRIHRNAPESVSPFFHSSVEMKPEHSLEYYKRFSDTLSISMIIPHEQYTYPNDFGMILQLYHMGRRNLFSGAFTPIMINISHQKEEKKPSPEETRDRETTAVAQEAPVDTPVVVEEDKLPQQNDVAKTPSSRGEPSRESTTRDDVFSRPADREDRKMEMKMERAESLINETRNIYHDVMTLYTQIGHHVDEEALNNLKAYADQLTQSNKHFEDMISDGLSNLPEFSSVQSNFYAYYQEAGEIINELTGEETVLPSRQKESPERSRTGFGWQQLVLAILAAFILLGGIIYLMKWRKKIRQKRLDKKIKRQANMEINKQKHMLKHKPHKQVKI